MENKSKSNQRCTGRNQREALSTTINKKQQINHSKVKKNKSKIQEHHKHAQSPNPVQLHTQNTLDDSFYTLLHGVLKLLISKASSSSYNYDISSKTSQSAQQRAILSELLTFIEKQYKLKLISSISSQQRKQKQKMIGYLHQEQNKQISLLKVCCARAKLQNMDIESWKDQIRRLYGYVTFEDISTIKIRQEAGQDLLKAIYDRYDELNAVTNYLFQMLEKLYAEKNNINKQDIGEISFHELTSKLSEITAYSSSSSGEVSKEQLEKENLKLIRQIEKIQEQFEYLVEDKLHLQQKLRRQQLRNEELKSEIHNLKITVKQITSAKRVNNSLRQNMKSHDFDQQQPISKMGEEMKFLETKLENQQIILEEKQLQINKYLKIIQKLKSDGQTHHIQGHILHLESDINEHNQEYQSGELYDLLQPNHLGTSLSVKISTQDTGTQVSINYETKEVATQLFGYKTISTITQQLQTYDQATQIEDELKEGTTNETLIKCVDVGISTQIIWQKEERVKYQQKQIQTDINSQQDAYAQTNLVQNIQFYTQTSVLSSSHKQSQTIIPKYSMAFTQTDQQKTEQIKLEQKIRYLENVIETERKQFKKEKQQLIQESVMVLERKAAEIQKFKRYMDRSNMYAEDIYAQMMSSIYNRMCNQVKTKRSLKVLPSVLGTFKQQIQLLRGQIQMMAQQMKLCRDKINQELAADFHMAIDKKINGSQELKLQKNIYNILFSQEKLDLDHKSLGYEKLDSDNIDHETCKLNKQQKYSQEKNSPFKSEAQSLISPFDILDISCIECSQEIIGIRNQNMHLRNINKKLEQSIYKNLIEKGHIVVNTNQECIQQMFLFVNVYKESFAGDYMDYIVSREIKEEDEWSYLKTSLAELPIGEKQSNKQHLYQTVAPKTKPSLAIFEIENKENNKENQVINDVEIQKIFDF